MRLSPGLRLVLGLVSVTVLLPGCGPESTTGAVPVIEVERSSFVRRISAEGNLKAVNSTVLTAPPDIPDVLTIGWLAPDGAPVAEGEVVVRFDPTGLKRSLDTGLANREKAELKLAKETTTAEAEERGLALDAEQAVRELEAARSFQKRDETLFSRFEIVESQIDGELAAAKQDQSERIKEIRSRLSAAERDLLLISKQMADLQIDKSEKGLSALEVTAPHDGLLILRRNWRGELPQVGQPVWSGEPLADVPDTSEMEAEVFVLEADAGGIAVGQRAEVVVEAHPDAVHAGSVKQMDSLARPRFRDSPVQYFTLTLALEETVESMMKPGVRVRATIWLDELEDVLVVPRQAVFQDGNRSWVYVRNRGRFVKKSVTLGPVSYGRVVVESGLSEGDAVALADPATEAEGEAEPPGSEEAAS